MHCCCRNVGMSDCNAIAGDKVSSDASPRTPSDGRRSKCNVKNVARSDEESSNPTAGDMLWLIILLIEKKKWENGTKLTTTVDAGYGCVFARHQSSLFACFVPACSTSCRVCLFRACFFYDVFVVCLVGAIVSACVAIFRTGRSILLRDLSRCAPRPFFKRS